MSCARPVMYPVTRYVDEDVAIIEAYLVLPMVIDGQGLPLPAEVEYRLAGTDGSYDEGVSKLRPVPEHFGVGCFKIEIASPERWWPAGLGEQALYDLKVTWRQPNCRGARKNGQQASCTFGVTSVRSSEKEMPRPSHLLVNGKEYHARQVVPIDPEAENRFLPIDGSTLLVVRAHYATDTLFDAADRAGVFMIQSVPLHPKGRPEQELADAVHRITQHPSVAGWYVGHLGNVQNVVAEQLQLLDPTRPIYRSIPALEAA